MFIFENVLNIKIVTYLIGTIIANLIYIAPFDTNGILTVLYIVIQYIQMHYMNI